LGCAPVQNGLRRKKYLNHTVKNVHSRY
jgi:hypothetical protein